MTLLITGGSGFIGTELVRYLLKNNFQEKIIIYDQFEPRNELKQIPKFLEHVQYIQGNLQEYEKIVSSLNDVDSVIHLAAIADVKKCQSEPKATRKINIDGTQTLLQAISKSKVDKIIFASTMSAIYGKSPIFDEKETPNPVSEYGKQKLECEKIIIDFSNKHSINSIILRKSNLYGVGIITKENVVAAFVKNALFNSKISIDGTGEQYRNFLNLKDVCQAYVKAISCNLNNSEIVNIAGPTTITLNKLAELVKNEVEHVTKNTIEIIHSETVRKDDFGKIKPPRISTTKARAILNYEPKITIEEGIRDLIKFYQS
jgi:nucleoside-diphosphate-sugar epimerase